MKRKNKKQLIFLIAAVCIVATGIWLALPSNYYVRQTLIHHWPRIDQYSIFENNVIRADNPQSWPLSENYNKKAIPEKYSTYFEKLGTVAYVIIQNGELLFEQYWEDYSPQSHSNSFSMAKSVVSLAIGCAIDDGYIRHIEQPVSDFFPQFTEYGGTILTIRHLLTMSAGMDFQESYTTIFSPTTQLYYGDNLNKITFGMRQIEEPGVHFIYQSGVTQLLANIVEKATGEKLSTYVSRKLWTPMQAEEDALWSLDRKDGIEKAYCCFNSNARDFARFGQLILNGGKWNGKTLISESYLREATTADNSLLFKEINKPNRHYGYQFWILEKNGMKIPYLRGMLGQYVFAIPDRNAVVVRLGHKRDSNYTNDDWYYPVDINVWLDTALEIMESLSF